MGIDNLSKVSNEQLLAMSMLGNGQVTNDSSSDSTTSNETNLAFQLVMQNLMESSKKTNPNSAEGINENGKIDGQAEGSEELNNKNNINVNNISRVIQKYAAGQKLEDIPMILSNSNYIKFKDGQGYILPNRNSADIEKIYGAVDSASKKYGVDSNLILAIIKQESNFDSSSTSGVGATGLMQIMPQNFAHLGISNGYDVDQNINGGTKLLKEYLDKYNGNAEMALMAYNGGPGTMQKRGVSSANDLYKMPLETQNYVPKVMGYYRSGV
ncbi:lytic transglycosylase domain-containing protein [Clostridium chromiireducens]|uniref:lytic transglycosylase domain-containing protein n=1 Tax=Clostridium chromiireducens TaxID=225345 RepID=UPI003AF6C948